MHILKSVNFLGGFIPESGWLAEWTCPVHQRWELLMCWRNVWVSGNRVACAVVHAVPLGKKCSGTEQSSGATRVPLSTMVQGQRKVDGSRRPQTKTRPVERLQLMMEMCWDANEPKRVDAGDKVHSDQHCDPSPDKQTDKPASLGCEWKEWASPFALFQSSVQPSEPDWPSGADHSR